MGLKNCKLIEKLFVFQDGIKKKEHEEEWGKVNKLIQKIDGCNVEIIISQFNNLKCVNDRSFYAKVIGNTQKIVYCNYYMVNHQVNNEESLVGKRKKLQICFKVLSNHAK